MKSHIRTGAWITAMGVSACLSAFAFADVTGKVTLDGKAPEMKTIDMSGVPACAQLHPDPVSEEIIVASDKGELKNVVVSVKKEEGQDLPGEAPKTPAVLDQKGCQYSPHVLAMMVGQDLLVKNSDPFLHNSHSLAEQNGTFNKGQPNVNDGEKMDPQPKTPETFRVKCDVHAWMSAYIAVFDHPYFSVTGDDGTFTIKGLPDGEYTLEAWHEKLPKQTQKITVKDGKTASPIEFKFKVEGADASPAMPVMKTVVVQAK
jgi:hypothetical protein